VEIAKADFADLGITRGNGFQDEVVQLRVLRGGVLIFSNCLQFSRNLVNDITFETDIRGTAAPELRAGDPARVSVNGHFTLRGRFQLPLISVTSNRWERSARSADLFFLRIPSPALLLSRRRRFLRLNVHARGAQS
jgi:hypothetical protein